MRKLSKEELEKLDKCKAPLHFKKNRDWYVEICKTLTIGYLGGAGSSSDREEIAELISEALGNLKNWQEHLNSNLQWGGDDEKKKITALMGKFLVSNDRFFSDII